MSIFSLVNNKCLEIWGNTDFNAIEGISNYFAFSSRTLSCMGIKTEGLCVKDSANSSYKPRVVIPGCADDYAILPIELRQLCIYKAEGGLPIYGFGSSEEIFGWFAFFDGKAADISKSDGRIVVLNLDYTYQEKVHDEIWIFTSAQSAGVKISDNVGGVPNRGYCEKYLLTPMTYHGIIPDNAYIADGGMSELSDGVCKIGDNYFFKVGKNIVTKCNEIIK